MNSSQRDAEFSVSFRKRTKDTFPPLNLLEGYPADFLSFFLRRSSCREIISHHRMQERRTAFSLHAYPLSSSKSNVTTKQEVRSPPTLLMDLLESEWLEKVINDLMFISLANALASLTERSLKRLGSLCRP